MDIITGVAFLVFWLLMEVFDLTVSKAALVTAIIFILVSLLWGRPWVRHP